MVVQRYNRSPYLVDGFKFDLRIYVLVLSCEPLKLYMFKGGMARFCTVKWDIKTATNYENIFMHLTNYSLNKDNENYIEGSDENGTGGTKRSMQSIFNQMAAEGVDVSKLQSDIEEVLVKTIIANQQELSHSYRTCQPSDIEQDMCFEILGFDIYIDNKLRPWLLEVN